VRRLGFRPGQMVSSLRQRNYRLFFFGQLISVMGTWMQTVAQSFLVLGLTHSGTQLGLTTAAKPRARALCLAAVGWGIAILAAAAAPNLTLELVALVFVGYGSITFNSLAKTTLQLAARPEMRGRVMALWALAWLGSTPIGGPIVGWAGQVAGARWALVIGGLATLICGILALPALARIDRQPPDRQPPDRQPEDRHPLANQATEAISSLSPAGYRGGLTASAGRQSTRRSGLSRMTCSSIS
jgi:MFS family permease